MKTLYLLRHAKSSWKDPNQDDFERPLLEKGLKRSKQVIDYLLKTNIGVDMIVSSPAVRAFATAKIFSHALKFPSDDIRIERNLYMGDDNSYHNQLFDVPKSVHSMMIVGHNPGITNFANQFLEEKIDYLPTSGIVSLSFETDSWDEVITAKRKTNFIVYPKMLHKD